MGTDPVDPTDSPDDTVHYLAFGEEIEVSFDLETEVQEVDVALLLDTTGSMGAEATAMAAEFSAIVDELSTTIDDAQYGFATYDDYAYSGMGDYSSGDKPFELRHQVSDDILSVQAQLDATPLHYGVDWPESTYEGLYQSLTGVGYDQGCDGGYDATTDVMPFTSSATDPFTGGGGEFYDSSLSGGGMVGGFGFREESLPVILYATDAPFRDADDAAYSTPGGCPLDAGQSDVEEAVADIGARLIGIATQSTAPSAEIEELALSTGSLYDEDGDGVAAEALAFYWTGGSAAFRTTIVNAIQGMLDSVTFSEVALEVDGDAWGFVTDISPEVYEDVVVGSGGLTLDFTVTIEGVVEASADDTIFTMTLNAYGDGTTLLGSQPLTIVVPGI